MITEVPRGCNSKNPIRLAPENGWKERHWYVVEVSFRPGNPIHRSLFYTGFLNGKDKTPGGYNGFVPLNGPSDEQFEWGSCIYLNPLSILCDASGNLSDGDQLIVALKRALNL